MGKVVCRSTCTSAILLLTASAVAAPTGSSAPNAPVAYAADGSGSAAPADTEPGSGGARAGVAQRGREEGNFVANDASIETLLDALSGRMKRPVIVSAKAKRKHVTGEFNLERPIALLRQLSQSMSLIWYDDGASIYVYDNSEIKSAIVSMQSATVRNVRDFISQARLEDPAFPIRGSEFATTFYITGAPIYVNLVTAAAKYLDSVHDGVNAEKQVVKIVPLRNSFVGDRTYTLRDKTQVVQGMATVLNQIYGGGRKASVVGPSPRQLDEKASPDKSSRDATRQDRSFSLSDPLPGPDVPTPLKGSAASSDSITSVPAEEGVRALAYSDTNSIVLAGPLDKVNDMEALIHRLDMQKRQIELSLWIVDIRKNMVDQLGVNWEGVLGFGQASIGLNNTRNASTLDGAKFLASVTAMSQRGDATIVSRPIVLTQENVQASFDNNQTFYTKLVGERSVQLEHVTYGTLVSVLPRLTENADDVEMDVNIEDGDADVFSSDSRQSSDGMLPLVNRTEINTVARVPRDKSLLIGGYTRDDVTRSNFRIPGLASIPLIGGLFRGSSERHNKVVRLFLIQPKLLALGDSWRGGQSWQPGDIASNDELRGTVQMLRPYMETN
ncbi:type III secretion system outer membrane ring subunit SctC [Pandoraea pulmonicola]|uniref:Type 3 secretion system secretin n=1 Tax=Pandoraea pulmonicola TaxID=93221 RepID=A0ABM5S6V1_PANPU|nr:type III secretion system outer membrane ring subunit SctC [Pandoraea pulmonicola]AJC23523.1 EscC/YscC/HrcC family type III secretion system outer membrane ring protein [Pandoraea pulmonicola]